MTNKRYDKILNLLEQRDKFLKEVERRLLIACPIFFVRIKRYKAHDGRYFRTKYVRPPADITEIPLTFIFFSGRLNKEFIFKRIFTEAILQQISDRTTKIDYIIDIAVNEAQRFGVIK